MKKFTLIATLLLAFAGMAKAEEMDKAFYKMTKFATIQDATVTAPETGTNPITVKSNKTNNTPRYLFTKWGEDAYAKCPAELPESGYSFSTNFTITVDGGVSNCMELVLAPVDATYKLTHMRLLNTTTYFFRMHQATNKSAEGVDSIYVNGDIENDADWNFGEKNGTLVLMTPGVKYNIRVNVSKDGSVSKYTIAEVESGNVIATGEKDITAMENKHIGMIWFNTGGGCTYDFDDMKLSTIQNGPFAEDPRADLLAVVGTERDYYAQFGEGETLHWIAPGQEEQTVAYEDANDTREFTQDPENFFGSKVIECMESGDLKIWTSRTDDDTNVSEVVTIPVVCENIAMPTPVATITNVSEGYAKTYKIDADNSNTLCQPTVTIHYNINGKTGNINSGESIEIPEACTVELYAYDGTHPTPWYSQSETVTIENNVEYVVAETKKYNVSFEEAATLGLTEVKRLVDLNKNGAAQSHWERIYSEEKRGYKEDGTNEAYAEGTEYSWVKSGFGAISSSEFTSGECGWNIYAASTDQIQTAFLPLIPSEEDLTIYKENGWAIFPLEGLVYDDVNSTAAVKKNPAGDAGYVEMTLDPKYTSDDASKPNFFIVNKTGGYDRPDKGDCTSSEVVVAGEKFWLYRYDTAISSVKVMTYKGFVPSEAGIATVNADAAAPAVKKMVTKNGIVIVKGNAAYSVAGAQIK